MTQVTRRTALAGGASAALLPFTVSSGHTAAPLSGKQAPGYYRYKVGDFEITVATDGQAATPLPDAYVANAPKDAVNAVLAASYMPTDKATHSYTPVVVNTGAKLVVIDTGLGPAIYEQSKGALGQFHTNLAAAGIDRNAVDMVIISHFHGDHVNGLLAADNKPAFPNAEITVPVGEWAYWMDDSNMNKAEGPLKGAHQNVRRVFDALGRKVTQYQGGKELVPGITAVDSPGHTLGHVSHMVTSGSDRVLIQADITAGMASLFVRNPDWQPIFDMDKPLAVQSRKKLYDMAVADKLLVQAFHASFPGVVRVEKDANGYRWVPASWSPVL